MPKKLLSRTVVLIAAIAIGFSTASTALAGSATWNANPTSGYWGFNDNWTPARVPKKPADTAIFDVSSITSLDQMVMSVGSVVFNPGASSYTLTPFNPSIGTMTGAGFINNSGVMQTVNVPAVPPWVGDEESHNLWVLANNARAGDLIQFMVSGSSCADGKTDDAGVLRFRDNASAGSATFIVTSGTKGYYDCTGGAGAVDFVDTSSAENGTFVNNGGLVRGGSQAHTTFSHHATAANARIINYGGSFKEMGGAFVWFFDGASAASATIINDGGKHVGAFGGQTRFFDHTTAANSTLIANSGRGDGGEILLEGDSIGGTAQVEVFGNANFDISDHNAPGVTIGSLEGDGSAFLGGNNLTVGSNNLDTSFAGVIEGTGSVNKIGIGTLILANANTYTHGTTVEAGFLFVNNTTGSGTGVGPVFVNAGTLSGDGSIGGGVNIGTSGGPGAALAPGRTREIPATLTIQRRLQLNVDGTYQVTLNSDTSMADQAAARGVGITGAKIAFDDRGSTVLAAGTVFTVISNTASSPISGTFNNLADGSTVTIGNNTYQASYEGGDGNDLTLTIVP